MCWCFPFGLSKNKNRKTAPSGEKRRRERAPAESLHGNGATVVAEKQEKRRSRETPRTRRSRETVTPRSPRRERSVPHQSQYEYARRNVYGAEQHYRPALNVQVPNMWYRSVDPDSDNSSQEMLLNPRPHRSPHERQRHPRRTSQSTLRGRGAKRDPPRHSKSKKNMRQESSSTGWSSLFSSPQPKVPSRQTLHYQTLDSSPRGHRSSRQHHATSQYQELPHSSQPQPQPRHHHQGHNRSRQQHRQQQSSTRSARSRTPNTAARRTPDRRFAVLAATNQALEDLRREAFAQPSPPPRRERLQRYQGVAIPTSTIPFNWDCVSSSQTSTVYGESSTQRRHRRR
jgi:hypothetical protein